MEDDNDEFYKDSGITLADLDYDVREDFKQKFIENKENVVKSKMNKLQIMMIVSVGMLIVIGWFWIKLSSHDKKVKDSL